MSLQRVLPLAGLLLVGLVPSRALAQECAVDADCQTGFQCIKGQSAPGCPDPEAGCPAPEPPPERGWCEAKPIECAQDSDCPSFMRCLEHSEGTCWSNPDGSTGCDEPSTVRVCEAVALPCASNADCPQSFECTESTPPCPAIECAPGQDCPPTDCAGSAVQICTPKAIACAQSSDCPSAWVCEEVATDCASPLEGGGADCKGATGERQCRPDGTLASVRGEDEAGATSQRTGGESSSSGCSVGSPSPAGAPPLVAGVLGALALLGLALRRR